MSWRVLIRPKAEEDLREASLWYESQLSGLGDQLLDEVRRAVHRLQEDPERHPVYYRGFRRFFTHRFPYKLLYRIEGDRIMIFRVLHAKQDHRWRVKD